MKADIQGRPLLAASLGLIGGISAAWHPVNTLFLVLLIIVVFPNRTTAIVAASSSLFGLLIAPPQLEALPSKQGVWSGTGKVATAPSLSPSGETCLVQTPYGVAQLIAKGRDDLALGQNLSIYGRVLNLHGEAGQRLQLEGALATISSRADDIRIIDEGPAIFRSAGVIRSKFISAVNASLDSSDAAIVDAICFASGMPVDSKLRSDVSRAGIAHILSASGLQAVILAVALQFILGLLPISRSGQVSVISIALLLYACATGLHASTIRAVIMAIVAMYAYSFRREFDFLSALGLAALITVVWQPWSVFSPGFQLSYIAVLALALFGKGFWAAGSKRLIDVIAIRTWLVLRASFIVSIATAPLLALHYGQIPLFSPIANLLVAPLLPAIIVLSMVAWPLGIIFAPLQVGIMHGAVAPLSAWLLLISEIFGGAQWSVIRVPSFNAYWLTLPYAAALLLYRRAAPRKL